jgi:RNA polymerase sigma factor (sigma-70 family)
MTTATHVALDRDAAIMHMDERAARYVSHVALKHRLKPEDRADMLSAVRIEVIKAVDRWRPNTEATLETYVTRRIAGAIIDHKRRMAMLKRTQYNAVVAGRMAPVRVRTLLTSDTTIAAPDGNDALYAHIDCTTLMERAELNATERACLMSYEADEIAREFGLTESTVHVYSSRAIQRLRATVLGEHGKMTVKQFDEARKASAIARETQKSALGPAGGTQLPPAVPKPRFSRPSAAAGGRGGIRWGGYRALWFAMATD